MAKGLKNLQLVIYQYNNTKGFISKYSLNKDIFDKKGNSYYNTQSYDYNKENNTLAILLMNENSDMGIISYSAKIIWSQLK